MAKTAIEQLQTVLQLGAEALEAYVNPQYGGGINANAAGGIFSNLISRHGINAETLRDLQATLEPIGLLMQDGANEAAAASLVADLQARFPNIVPNTDKLLLRLSNATDKVETMAQNGISDPGYATPVPVGAVTFSDKHALVSALVDTEVLLLGVKTTGLDPEPGQWIELLDTVEDALVINDEVKAIAAEMRANLDGDVDEAEDEEHPFLRDEGGTIPEGSRTIVGDNGPLATAPVVTSEVGGFTPREEVTTLSEAAFDNAPGQDVPGEPEDSQDNPPVNPNFNPEGVKTGRLPRKPRAANTPRSKTGRGRGRAR